MQVEVVTGTKEWHDLRSKGIGGSEVPVILGLSEYKTPYRLWLEKTGKEVPEDISTAPHVVRGVLGEKTARMIISQQTGHIFKPTQWQIDGTIYRCSDDGYCADINTILEIKCMGKDDHAAALNGTIPEKYIAQVQWNLFVTKASECWFISYQPEESDETKSICKIVVKPDEKFQKKLIKAVDKFWKDNVLGNEPPELTNKDFIEITEPDTCLLASEYKSLKTAYDSLEEKIEELKAQLKEKTKEFLACTASGVKISRYTKKGNIDYSKIPQLKDVDLEKFRKSSVEVFSIRTT